MNLNKLKSKYDFDMIVDYKNETDTLYQDTKYTKQFVNVFYLEHYESLISEIIEKIYLEIKDNENFKKWMSNIDKSYSVVCPEDCSNELMKFMLLFSFDNFQTTHNYLKSLYNNEIIDNSNIMNDNLNK
tara:strand:+ start:1908 stop:2294 length:387 start_codon:yes stop_codon:yes gene_type:complete